MGFAHSFAQGYFSLCGCIYGHEVFLYNCVLVFVIDEAFLLEYWNIRWKKQFHYKPEGKHNDKKDHIVFSAYKFEDLALDAHYNKSVLLKIHVMKNPCEFPRALYRITYMRLRMFVSQFEVISLFRSRSEIFFYSSKYGNILASQGSYETAMVYLSTINDPVRSLFHQ